MIDFFLQMPDVGSDELFHVNCENRFLFAWLDKNLAQSCLENMLQFTKKTNLNYPLKQHENSYVQHCMI